MNGMIEFFGNPQTRERRGEVQLKAAMERQAKMAGANREPRAYVVRDLSWELARYLETESL